MKSQLAIALVGVVGFFVILIVPIVVSNRVAERYRHELGGERRGRGLCFPFGQGHTQ
jgi:hypothetical protein